jgi:hypothetical protein
MLPHPGEGAIFVRSRVRAERCRSKRIVMKPSWMALTCLAGSQAAFRKRSTSAPCILLACGTFAVAISASASSLKSCKPEQAIYRATTDSDYEIEFFRDFQTQPDLAKSGILRYRGSAGLVEYEFLTTWSNGLTRPYLFIEQRSSTNRSPTANEERNASTENEQRKEEGPSSVILMFSADFLPPRDNKSAPPYLVLPDLGRDFHYWFEEQARHPGENILPPLAWKLVSCGGAR